MHLRKNIIAFLILNTIIGSSFAQDTGDSAVASRQEDQPMVKPLKNTLNYKNLIVPAIFVGYGIASLKVDALKGLNSSTKNEILEDQPQKRHLDNYTQYAPAVLVFGLDAAGVKAKHSFVDRTIIYATSQLISGAFVVPLKHLVKEERPDSSNSLSFPSGHTSTAFSSAHFMFKEYKDKSIWLGISGYAFAAFTGVYRTINNKHWVGDVVAGAGFGILSTELAYWTYPKIKALLSRRNMNSSTMIMPYYSNKTVGLGFVKTF